MNAIAPASSPAPILMTYAIPVTDLSSRVLGRVAGFCSEDDDAPAKRTVHVHGRVDGQPFEAIVTMLDDGRGGEETLAKGCAEDCEDDARWHLEPFLGELSRAQVEAIVAAVTEEARGTV